MYITAVTLFLAAILGACSVPQNGAEPVKSLEEELSVKDNSSSDNSGEEKQRTNGPVGDESWPVEQKKESQSESGVGQENLDELPSEALSDGENECDDPELVDKVEESKISKVIGAGKKSVRFIEKSIGRIVLSTVSVAILYCFGEKLWKMVTWLVLKDTKGVNAHLFSGGKNNDFANDYEEDA